MNVAFLGLGSIGLPMARRIALAGVPLTVWNRTASKAVDFAAESAARVALNPADAARGADIVITCFPSSRELVDVMAGDRGLMAGLSPGAVLLDCTSGDPATSRLLAMQLREKDVAFMDAPVSGGVAGAVKGELTVMCGGAPETLERVRPVIELFGRKIVHCGDVGTGDALKAMNNALLAIHVWSTGEALAAVTKAGVDPAVALDVINSSSGRSNTSMNLFPERVLTRAFPRTFRLALLEKDIGIAAGIARELRVPSPIMQLTAELFTMARNELGEVADHVEAVKIVEQWAGTEIVAGGPRGAIS